ncbi:hypothetical protein AVEN_173643-1 [Araneus ventricosus]|uniref:Uncharacterized protein n=1 Tax=Araneus ventricosus TaxID=182803 RepID=A0A4Y2CLJ4_ARAVE|nr:hypothetical protein AVEN_38870-1 [Araneus ventricosus]GBM05282.1 hypothetical protein AVEN_173643-1 [Araneus ventricosus]
MTRMTPELAPPSPKFHATPTGGYLATTYDLTCKRPHTRRIFSGIGSRTWNPPAPKPVAFKIIRSGSNVLTLVWRGSSERKVLAQVSSSSDHRSKLRGRCQNCLVLLQNGTLI